MLRFLILICVVFSCLELSGQEIIFINKDCDEVINHVKTLKSYDKKTFESTLLIEAKDSIDNNHYYVILKANNLCISQLHIYNDSIELNNVLHVFQGYEIIEKNTFKKGKYYRNYHEYKQEGAIY